MNQLLETKNDRTADLVQQLQLFADQIQLDSTTNQRHIRWLLRYFRFHSDSDLQADRNHKVSTFLSYLANELNYDSAIQRQALQALEFLYQDFYQLKLEKLVYSVIAQRQGYAERFGISQCQAVIAHLDSRTLLFAKLLVQTQLKLNQLINLRVGDIDLKKNQFFIRQSNKQKLIVNIPVSLILELRIQIMKVKQIALNRTTECEEIAIQLQDPNCQFLFPSSHFHLNKSAESILSPVLLATIKNNIQLAIKRYQRNAPLTFTTSVNRQQIPQSRLKFANFSERVRTATLPKVVFNSQVSFNFDNAQNFSRAESR